MAKIEPQKEKYYFLCNTCEQVAMNLSSSTQCKAKLNPPFRSYCYSVLP